MYDLEIIKLEALVGSTGGLKSLFRQFSLPRRISRQALLLINMHEEGGA